jgi:ribosomal RNA-processing protein 36
LSSIAKDLRHEQEQEIIRLEQAIKRAEGLVNADHQRNVERTALRGIKEEEKQKRQSGKGSWWLKKGMYFVFCS